MKLKLLFGIALISHVSTQHAISAELRKTIVQTGKAAELVAAFIATHLVTSWIHESSHLVTAKIALVAGAEPLNENYRLEFEDMNNALIRSATYPTFKNNLVNIVVAGIGPVAGVASAHGILKANNILNEYLKRGNFKEAYLAGMKKSLLNKEQNRGVQAAAVSHIVAEGYYLIPHFSDNHSEN